MDVELKVTQFFVPDFEVIYFQFDRWFRKSGILAGTLAPGIAKPNGGEDMKGGAVRSVVGRGDPPEKVVVIALRNFLNDVKESVVLEHPGVFDLILALVPTAFFVFLPEIAVGIGILRIAVESLGIRVGWGAVLVKVDFLNVFPVIALMPG